MGITTLPNFYTHGQGPTVAEFRRSQEYRTTLRRIIRNRRRYVMTPAVHVPGPQRPSAPILVVFSRFEVAE